MIVLWDSCASFNATVLQGRVYKVSSYAPVRWFGEAEESFLHNVKEDKKTAEAESAGIRAEAPKMLWADSVSTADLIYRIPYFLIGLRIPEDEWRGKDTSLTHLKNEEYTKDEAFLRRELRHHMNEDLPESPGLQLLHQEERQHKARWKMIRVKKKHDGFKRYKARLLGVKVFFQAERTEWVRTNNEISSPFVNEE
ncbi:hypothetical protein Tco_0491376 [Tanacetum coccineum]